MEDVASLRVSPGSIERIDILGAPHVKEEEVGKVSNYFHFKILFAFTFHK